MRAAPGLALLLAVAALLAACTSEAERRILLARESRIERGGDYALTHCAGCHNVDVEGESPYRSAPPFRDLRGWDGLSLTVRLERSPLHRRSPDMPARRLTPREADDVAAFIAALRAGHGLPGRTLRPQLCNPMLFC